jgi:TolA-binding protein
MLGALGLALLLSAIPLAAQAPPDQAGMLLAGARRAFNEKNYPFAADRFREFLAKFGGHKDAPSARYGLALCLLEGPTRDYDKALETLQPIAGTRDFSEHPFVLYYLGLSRRGQGLKALELATSRPAEANTHRNTARDRFDQAAKDFAAAVTAFNDRAKAGKPPEKGEPPAAEWAARARCEQAEMLLRVRKPAEAREATAGFLAERSLLGSRYRKLGLYYNGLASFLMNDLFAAGKALTLLTPFDDSVFGTHARYLLARVHHLNTKQNEREEARVHYQGVLTDHEAQKKKAENLLRQPDKFRNDPEERARLERLLRGPAPDHVARAHFFLGVMQYEDGRFGEAHDHLKNFITQHPTATVVPEARLRQGFCLVQLRQFVEAVKILQPLADKEPLLADQALLWIAKAQVGQADPAKPVSYGPAIATFRQAADRAQQRLTAAPPDPGARTRRGEVMLELAETMQLAKQFRDATGVYQQILNEKLLPARDEETLLNLAAAWQLAGDYNESDKICDNFRTAHPKSTLLPPMQFRSAENAYFRARAAEKLPNPADRTRETAKWYDEAIKRYSVVVEKYPESPSVQLARYGLGMAHYRRGDIEKAQAALESIPPGDRVGDLTMVSYQLADILIRQAPERAEDAVAAGKVEEMMKTASELLETYIGAAPESENVPDALLKLGFCQQRMASILSAQPAEQQKVVAAARATYERLLQKYPRHPSHSQGVFERAKCLALARDVGNAVNELRKFNNDPLKKAPIAPMALLHLSTLLRGQNKPAEAADVLEQCRKDHEADLGRDPARSAWVPLLQYHQAVALREAGKYDAARGLFDAVARGVPDRVEGWESALRAGQCQKEHGEKRIAEASRKLANPGLNADQRGAAQKDLDAGLGDLRAAVTYLATQADAMKTRKPANDEQNKALTQTRSRMLYESAWGWRTLAELEIREARKKNQLDQWQKRRDELARKMGPGQPIPNVAMPEVPLAAIPVQPAETQARARYRALIDAFPDVANNADARFELAELLAERTEHDAAIKLLQEALEKEPPADLTDKIKVRLATAQLDRGMRKVLAARKKLPQPGILPADKAATQKMLEEGNEDIKTAQEQLQAIADNPKSPVFTHATYREAECLLHLGKPDEAVKRLIKFRDQAPFQNIPGLTDRALLRLGAALAGLKQWEPSRQAYETLVNRFPASPWVHEARYGMAWAWQNQGQHDQAVNTYTQVTSAVATDLGARAQLNIGLCRLAQKRHAEASAALLMVPYVYDYPDLSALALIEAARALSENKQTDQAVKLLRRVLRDHPDSAEAGAARKRLAELGEG